MLHLYITCLTNYCYLFFSLNFSRHKKNNKHLIYLYSIKFNWSYSTLRLFPFIIIFFYFSVPHLIQTYNLSHDEPYFSLFLPSLYISFLLLFYIYIFFFHSVNCNIHLCIYDYFEKSKSQWMKWYVLKEKFFSFR